MTKDILLIFQKIKTLGWKPKRNLNNEIKSIIKWYSNNYKIFKFKISNL